MDSLYIPILMASAVALLVWGISTAVKGLTNAEKRRLQSRLAAQSQGGGGGGGSSHLPLSITREVEAGAASEFLSRWRPLESLPTSSPSRRAAATAPCAASTFPASRAASISASRSATAAAASARSASRSPAWRRPSKV